VARIAAICGDVVATGARFHQQEGGAAAGTKPDTGVGRGGNLARGTQKQLQRGERRVGGGERADHGAARRDQRLLELHESLVQSGLREERLADAGPQQVAGCKQAVALGTEGFEVTVADPGESWVGRQFVAQGATGCNQCRALRRARRGLG